MLSILQQPRKYKIVMMITMLVLATLACFSYDFLIAFDETGNGDGVIYLTLTLPGEMFSDPEIVQSVMDDLSNDGWEEVSMHQEGNNYLFNGTYPFSTDPNGKLLSDIFPDMTIKIEEAENEYRYFTLDGQVDFTDLSETWNEIENTWAKEGLVADSDVLIYDEGQVIFSAEDIQAIIDQHGEPHVTIKVQMPGQTPVEASAGWNNREDYMNGKTNTLEFNWNPDVRLVTPLKAIRRIEPLTYVTEDQANNQIAQIVEMYENTIETGNVSSSYGFSGLLNNWLVQPLAGGHYSCSEYQQQVLLFLDQIRTSPDSDIRKLLDGLDYGPIDTNHEGHLAVVLYQRDTDWQTTGIVLDPWPTQSPQAYPISGWSDAVWWYDASSPNPDHESGQFYPHLTGGTPSYPAASEFKGDLSVEKQLAQPTKVLYFGSPITPLLTAADGRQVGVLPDGSFVNDFGAGINIYSAPKPDGSGGYEWLVLLPDLDFEVTVRGESDGSFHTYLGTADGVVEYGAQPISAGGEATLNISSTSGPQPLVLEDGTAVAPVEVQPENSSAPTEDTSGVEVPQEQTGENAQSNTEWVTPTLLIFCCCSGAGAVGVGALIFVLLRKKKN